MSNPEDAATVGEVRESLGEDQAIIEEVQEDINDLRGLPREDEVYKIRVEDKEYQLVPAKLRDIPKITSLLKKVTEGEDGETDLDMLSEKKIEAIAEIILLSLSKEDRKQMDTDKILDNCSLAVFPLAIKAALGMNDFLLQMGQLNRMTATVT